MIRIDLPHELVTYHGRMLPSNAIHWVLREDIAEWIEEHGIPCRIEYLLIQPLVINYQILFDSASSATLFKLTWM